MQKQNLFKKIFILTIFLVKSLFSIDNPHFYRASHFFSEPRLAKDKLMSLDIWVASGKTSKGFNQNGTETNILNIYGPENFKFLTKNVPESILNKYPNSILNDLWKKNTDENFAIVDLQGKFRIVEAVIDFYQNFKHGFFGQVYLPVRKLKIRDINYFDRSTSSNANNAINFNEWKRFIFNLKENIEKYGLCFHNVNTTGPGDLSLLLGWTFNYENTKYLDFIDGTIKTGLLFPTGKQKNIDQIFDLPTGYNGHLGFPIISDFSFGIYEWLTVGMHAGALFFLSADKIVRMKTARKQNGFIKLAKGNANVNEGTIWNLGFYIKADHFINGLSLIFSYRFDKQQKAKLTPCDLRKFLYKIVNSDKQLAGWQMNTLNFMAEYDFSNQYHPDRPRIQLFVDLPVSGKQIFKTKMIGVGVGIDYVW